ncbi:hypothetical protein AFCDBAGC_4738 [Methylobacterium cerastii]|uniref:Uncharacterized protein n=1 Tax=Methylobacterium cerastii TaxID=932741 RepID=A0ABQ4QNK7_9HYPH|nr:MULTISPECIES: hypothetical protein [Methylobacterium]TXN80847.1 hypothetical protein FV234_15570 [Methylobacterium sp. WL8]TXM68895.1 hypothetical protein FV229_06560 [Methylobacterium sp. WL120]TXM75048.1 hypothetical protein FV226_05030 [Methylobacterium sp. WL12]TXM99816.1 hypothetical protein FV222_12590 [Methylobacterium sp. WL103]GJD46853.1 hypothetical protein AFCDBAGC_4738 [Methylobacterium cerastii]
MQAIGSFVPQAPVKAPARRAMPRKHKLMLLIAFEVLVLGFALAEFRPIRPSGILIETTGIPNHIVT